MGKKPAIKISKNHHPQEIKKPQLSSSLIKVLKPKVFITHSSNFKTLVQQLTGNGSPLSSPTTPPTPITHNLEDHHHHHHPMYQEPTLDESSMDNSSEGSVPMSSSSSFGSVQEFSVDIPRMEEPFNMLYEFPECNNLEPWAFATDLCSYDNSVASCDDDVYVPFIAHQQEGVSVFDYDLCCSYDDYPIQY